MFIEEFLTVLTDRLISLIKVKTSWEGHKFWKNLPSVLTIQLFLLSSVKTRGRFFQIFVAFSEKLDYKEGSVVFGQNERFLVIGILDLEILSRIWFVLRRRRVLYLIFQGNWLCAWARKAKQIAEKCSRVDLHLIQQLDKKQPLTPSFACCRRPSL